MNKFDFDSLARQSPKGIVINYFVILYKVFKSSWYIIPYLLTRKSVNFSVLIPIAIGVAILILIIAVLQYLNFKFKIENDHFVLHKGVFFKSKTSIPLERIQNVNFKQNIIHQIINVTQVEIQTAGSKGAEVSIKAISKGRANALKDRLQEVKYVDNELEEVAITESKTLFKLSFMDLLKVSFSENHIRSFFWIFAIIVSFFYQLKDYFKDFDFFSEAINYYLVYKNEIAGSFYLLMILMFVIFIISIVVSFVRVVLKHFDQRVTQINDGIQLSQGLFTKRTDVLKINKIQYAVTVSNPIKKKLGIQTVRIKQAGSAKVKQKKMIEFVGVRDHFMQPLNQLFFKHSMDFDEEVIKPARYYLFKLSVKAFLLLMAVNLVLLFTTTIQSKIIINAFLIPFLILNVLLTYRKAYVFMQNEKLIVGSGSIGTVTTSMEYFKTQNVSFEQSFIQKRRGVANVYLQTASGVIKIRCLKESDAKKIVETIVESASNSNRDWI